MFALFAPKKTCKSEIYIYKKQDYFEWQFVLFTYLSDWIAFSLPLRLTTFLSKLKTSFIFLEFISDGAFHTITKWFKLKKLGAFKALEVSLFSASAEEVWQKERSTKYTFSTCPIQEDKVCKIKFDKYFYASNDIVFSNRRL